MREFDNGEYTELISKLLHDTQYVEISNTSKIGGLRRHTEVLVRKILNIGSDYQLMLGQVRLDSPNEVVKNGLDGFTPTHLRDKLIQTVGNINHIARDGAHTKRLDDYSDAEISQVEGYILDLYAYMFIKFFIDNNVNLYFSSIILNEFSYLPPIIRYKTWKYLYDYDKSNLQVANKLCLSIIKTYGKEEAYQWLNDNKTDIMGIHYPTPAERYKYIIKCGFEINPGQYQVSLNFDKFNNMYDLLYDKISDPRTSINEKGKLYSSFEEAIKFYNNRNEYSEDTQPYQDFSSLMQFVFIGRVLTD